MKINITFIVLILSIFNAIAQEERLPLEKNIFLQHLNSNAVVAIQPSNVSLGKKAGLVLPVSDFFETNGNKPNKLLWQDSSVLINDLSAIFDSKNELGINYNAGFAQADMLTSLPINTTNELGNKFVLISYSTGLDWQNTDSLLLQVKGDQGIWKTIWVSNNVAAQNRDVYLNLELLNDLKSTVFQFRLVGFYNTDSDKVEIYKIHKLAISSKNSVPFYEPFRTYNLTNFTPSQTNWTNISNTVTRNDSAKMIWGNSLIFNSLGANKISYQNNSGLYGGADTLTANPFDLVQASPNDQLVLSFWYRSFAQTRSNDSLYIETLDNLGRWQRTWASGITDTNYKKVNIPIIGGRLRHSFFSFRIINKGTYLNSDSLSFAIAALKLTAKRNLPLFEDFSDTKGVYPNPEQWVDNKVFVNNNFPKNQPSKNVATFDGLDENGNAYSKFPTKSVADMLTSKGFDFTSYSLDDSIYFSFYYQYQLQGTTGQIYPTDSLYLEFKSNPNDKDSFEIVWQKSALDTLGYDTFNRVLMAVPAKFFHDDFQFRFKNIGSLTGNVSHWHIDYIKLDAGRSLKDTFNDDVAISATPTSMLKKYRSMPWSHFVLNKTAYTNDSLYFSVFNNNNRNFSVDYRRQLFDNENSIVFTKNNTIGSVPFSVSTPLQSVSNGPTNLNATGTDLVKKFTNTIAVSSNGFAGNDNVPTNDSISTTTIFSNYFAYDDGSAEAGYGIKLKTNAAVALAFDLEKFDTIYGVQIFFNQSELDVSSRKFDLVVWNEISPIRQNATSDRVIYRKNGLTPIYSNTINGFATIRFDSAVVVSKRFYIGWEQLGQFVLNIGLDENYYQGNKFVTNPNMFYKTDGFWLPTEIPGALMIRPILGLFPDVPTQVKEIKQNTSKLDFQVFPNPANDYFNIQTPEFGKYEVTIFDLMGQQIEQSIFENEIKTIHLPNSYKGVFLVHLTQLETGKTSFRKIVIN